MQIFISISFIYILYQENAMGTCYKHPKHQFHLSRWGHTEVKTWPPSLSKKKWSGELWIKPHFIWAKEPQWKDQKRPAVVLCLPQLTGQCGLPAHHLQSPVMCCTEITTDRNTGTDAWSMDLFINARAFERKRRIRILWVLPSTTLSVVTEDARDAGMEADVGTSKPTHIHTHTIPHTLMLSYPHTQLSVNPHCTPPHFHTLTLLAIAMTHPHVTVWGFCTEILAQTGWCFNGWKWDHNFDGDRQTFKHPPCCWAMKMFYLDLFLYQRLFSVGKMSPTLFDPAVWN